MVWIPFLTIMFYSTETLMLWNSVLSLAEHVSLLYSIFYIKNHFLLSFPLKAIH